MRTCLIFLLAIMLSLNAAYATSLGVCDALEHVSNHTAHFGHHSHEDSDYGAHDEPQASGDEVAVSGHHHDHVHPSFSVILPCNIGIMPLIEHNSLVVIPVSSFVSAPQALIEYPPKATLA